MIRAAVRAARRAPALSAVMIIALTHASAFWMMAEAAHDVETRHLQASHPSLYRVLGPDPTVPPPGLDAWLPNHWGALLLPTQTAERLRLIAPDAVVATFSAPMPVRAGAGPTTELNVRFATRALFAAFDRSLTAGRTWAAEADGDAAVRELVVRDTTARRWFGDGEPLGQSIELRGLPFRVVGLVPRGDGQPFDLRFAADDDEVFVPWAQSAVLQPTPALSRPQGGAVNVWAELPGSTQPNFLAGLPAGFEVLPYLRLWQLARMSDPAVELFRGFALIALLACGFSVARLMATRFLLQAPATAVRRALGASRTRLFVAHLGEAMLLGLIAGAIAPALAIAGTQLQNVLMHKRVGDYRVDLPLALAGAAIAVVTAALAGLGPAWGAARAAPVTYLRAP